jgi:hypothetical protein
VLISASPMLSMSDLVHIKEARKNDYKRCLRKAINVTRINSDIKRTVDTTPCNQHLEHQWRGVNRDSASPAICFRCILLTINLPTKRYTCITFKNLLTIKKTAAKFVRIPKIRKPSVTINPQPG